MKTIAFLARKGGVGKTTMTLNAAGAAADAGLKVVVYDYDPQGSLTYWANLRRQVKGITERPVVVNSRGATLAEAITACEEERVDLLLIDTRPQVEVDAVEATRAADLVVIPTRPGALDLDAITVSARIAAGEKVPAIIVINQARPGPGPHGAAINLEATRLLQSAGYAVAPSVVTQRVAFTDSVAAGATVFEYNDSKAKKEIKALWTHIWSRAREEN